MRQVDILSSEEQCSKIRKSRKNKELYFLDSNPDALMFKASVVV